MKDALGHGSFGNANRADLARNKIGLAPGARFAPPPPRPVKLSTNGQIADLRNRLSAPKQGLIHSFLNGMKRALGN